MIKVMFANVLSFVRVEALKTHNSFAIIALLFGSLYVVFTPPLWGLDEVAHFNRVYQVAAGHVLPVGKQDNTQDTHMPKNIVELNYYTYGDLMNNKPRATLDRKDVDDSNAYNKLLSKQPGTQEVYAPIVSTYSPVAYIGSVVGMFFGRILHLPIGGLIESARFGSLFFYIALVYISLYMLRTLRIKWLFFFVALMPSPLSLASVISADGAVLALSMLLVACLMSTLLVKNQSGKWQVSLAIIAAFLLPLAKLNYIVLSAAILLIPRRYFSDSRYKSITLKIGTLLTALVVLLVYTKISMFKSAGTGSPRPDGQPVDAGAQLSNVLHDPLHFLIAVGRSFIDAGDRYIQSATSYIGWNETPYPVIFMALILGILLFTAVSARTEIVRMKRQIYVLAALSVVGIASIFGSLYLVFTPVGASTVQGVQGRYLIPFLVCLIPLVVLILDKYIGIDITLKRYHPAMPSVLAMTILTVSIGYYLVATY